LASGSTNSKVVESLRSLTTPGIELALTGLCSMGALIVMPKNWPGRRRLVVWSLAGVALLMGAVAAWMIVGPVYVGDASCGSAWHARTYVNGGDPGHISPCRAAGESALTWGWGLAATSTCLAAALLIGVLVLSRGSRSTAITKQIDA